MSFGHSKSAIGLGLNNKTKNTIFCCMGGNGLVNNDFKIVSTVSIKANLVGGSETRQPDKHSAILKN